MEGSKIYASTKTFGMVLYIEAEYPLGKYVILNTKLAYKYSMKIDDLEGNTEDKYHKDKANIDIENFYNEILLSGRSFGMYIKFIY